MPTDEHKRILRELKNLKKDNEHVQSLASPEPPGWLHTLSDAGSAVKARKFLRRGTITKQATEQSPALLYNPMEGDKGGGFSASTISLFGLPCDPLHLYEDYLGEDIADVNCFIPEAVASCLKMRDA
jgi:hypothetical protein